MRYITIQYNTIQYNTIQYNTVQYSTVQYSTIQYNTIQYSNAFRIYVFTSEDILPYEEYLHLIYDVDFTSAQSFSLEIPSNMF
jgi:hypothetical protein